MRVGKQPSASVSGKGDSVMGDYPIELNLNEQRMAIMTVIDQLTRQYYTVDRKRSMRPSEKAMTKGAILRHTVALQMAVYRIDELLKIQNAA